MTNKPDNPLLPVIQPCPKCRVGNGVRKSNLSPSEWIECDACGFMLGAWESCWNELSRPTPEPGEYAELLERVLQEAGWLFGAFARGAGFSGADYDNALDAFNASFRESLGVASLGAAIQSLTQAPPPVSQGEREEAVIGEAISLFTAYMKGGGRSDQHINHTIATFHERLLTVRPTLSPSVDQIEAVGGPFPAPPATREQTP